MKNIIVSVFLLYAIISAHSQDGFRAFIDSAYSITDSAVRVAYVEEFVAHLDTAGTPLIEADTANFIYHGSASTSSVEIAGDFNGWGNPETWACDNIPYTRFFYRSHTFEPDARLDYKLILNMGSWILDPLNPNTVTGGYGANSELAMPAYIQPWEIIAYPDVSKGSIENFTLESAEIDKNFSIQVYLPPGYAENTSYHYPVVYVHDGHEYLSLGSMNNVIDNLLDSNKIDPLIGVFIRPNNREDEYAGDNRFGYAQFVVETVVTHIDNNYRTLPWKNYRLTMGASLGGNTSGLIAYTYPEVFANSGWHSPALWPNEGEVAAMYMEEEKDVKIYYNRGTYENLGVDWDLFNSRLTELGYTYDWALYHEGHSWGLWRATIDDILKYFFPAGSVPLDVESTITHSFSIDPNYPNPFNRSTRIPLSIEEPGKYTLMVYNQNGQLVQSDAFYYSKSGKYSIELQRRMLPGGIYYVVLSSQKQREFMKISVK